MDVFLVPMKRFTSFVMVFACVLLLYGCRNNIDSLIWVHSNGEVSKPYENFIWAQNWSEHGWLSADGMSIALEFSNIHNEIPQINYGEDFEIHYNDGVEFVSLSVYSQDFERIHHNVEEQVLNDLASGTYYLVINVRSQGEYIEAEEKYEYSGYECVYQIMITE